MSSPASPETALDAVEAALALLGEVDWDAVPAAELPAAVVRLERIGSRLDGTRLRVAGRVEDTDAAAAHGWASTKDFLTAAAGGRKGTGGGLLRLEAGLRALPATRAALEAGRLSTAQARVVVTRIGQLPRVEQVRATAERLLLERAGDHDATDLDRAWPEVVAELDPDGELRGRELSLRRVERAAHGARFLAFSPDQFGGVRIRGYATVEEVELVKAALVPLAAPVTGRPGECGGAPWTHDAAPEDRRGRPCPDPVCAHDGRDPRDYGVRLWDALVEGCRRLLTTRLLPESHAAPARMLVTVDLADLRRRLADRTGRDGTELGGRTGDGEPLSVTTVRRLACDAEIIPVGLGTAGQVLDVGRAARLVTPAIWTALIARDRHCAHPGCRRPPIACDAHHIQHWADGGRTSLDNLILLCRRHHTLIHTSPWTVRIDPDTGRPVWTPPPRVDDSRWITRHHPPPVPGAA